MTATAPEGGSSGRVLGLDLGEARFGLAISDPDRRVAVPVGTIRTGPPADVKAIARMVHENQVTEVVVGLPLSLAGRRGAAADHAERFGRALRDLLEVPVTLQDERLTTVEAERALRRAGVRGPDRRDVIDQHAAVLILQAFLDRTRSGT